MTGAALLLLALAPAADPVEAHDILLEVGDKPAVRLRLKVELDGRPLANLDRAAGRDLAAVRGKPGAAVLQRLLPEGALLRAEIYPAHPHPAALSRAIFQALDANGDGQLSADELAAAEQVLLGKFDLDDDECITPLELVPDLQTVVPATRPPAGRLRVRVVPVEGRADVERTVALGRSASHWRGTPGGVAVEIHARPALAGEKPVLPRALLTAGREEARAAFERAAPGVVSLSVVPGPVGLFDLLDADRDGQISRAELRRAKTVLADRAAPDTAVSLILVPGVAKPPAVPLLRTFARTAGPAWFRAMDANGDGCVSPREFLGTAEQFRTLDRDGDGLIDPAEAERGRTP